MRLRQLAIGIALGLAASIFPFANGTQAYGSASSDVSSFLSQINSFRAGKGLQPLSMDSRLNSMAYTWTQHLVAINDLAHNPELGTLAPSTWTKLGENVGMGGTVSALMTAFIQSPEHYANLVNPYYDKIGIAVIYNGSEMFTTHDFMADGGGSYGMARSSSPSPSLTTASVHSGRAVTHHYVSHYVAPKIVTPAAPPVAPKPEVKETTLDPERTYHSMAELGMYSF